GLNRLRRLAAGYAANILAFLVIVTLTGSETLTPTLIFTVVVPAQLGASLLALSSIRTRRGFAGFAEAYGLSIETSDVRYLALGAGLNILLAFAVSPIAQALPSEENPLGSVEIIKELEGPFAILAAALVLAVGVPVVEEVAYRGLLLRLSMQRTSAWTAVIVSSVVFALAHIVALRSFDRETLVFFFVVVVPVFLVLGVVMAWLTLRHGRLGPAIFVHSGYDLLSFVLLVAAPTLFET
ncbi:MAG: lysostaphin resistance A-like protein, partial [Acidimicrobiia bacterium]